MTVIERRIEIRVPAAAAAASWLGLDELARVMHGIDAVRRIGPDRSRWRARIAGRPVDWEARTVTHAPDHVSWRTTSGAVHEGELHFATVATDRCELELRIRIAPRGPWEWLALRLGLVQRQVTADLERFRDVIEGRAAARNAVLGAVRGPVPALR